MLFVSRSYEPELFPGLIYRMVKPRIVLLIFVSGKVVLTGMVCVCVGGGGCCTTCSSLADKLKVPKSVQRS